MVKDAALPNDIKEKRGDFNLKRAMVMHEMAQGFDSQGLTLRRGRIGKVMLPKKRKALCIK